MKIEDASAKDDGETTTLRADLEVLGFRFGVVVPVKGETRRVVLGAGSAVVEALKMFSDHEENKK